MGVKWLIIFAAAVAIVLGLLVGHGFDDMNADIEEASEERSGDAVERLPIPPAAE